MSLDQKILWTRIFLILFGLGMWEGLCVVKIIDPYFFGQPTSICQDLWSMIIDGSIFFHTWITLFEAMAGFFLGAVFGCVAALLLGMSPFWAKVLDPLIMVVYGIPRIALAPLFILWFGLGLASKIVFAFILVFFLVFFNTFAGLKNMNQGMINTIRVMGASRRQIMHKVILPGISPWVMAGLKSGMGMSLLGALVGEYIGGNAGLGWMINSAAGLFETNRVFSAIFALALLVMATNAVFNKIERRVLKWRPENINL